MVKLKQLVSLCAILFLAACNVTSSPTAIPTENVAPTVDAARTEAAQTVEAEIAQRPTWTALPTNTTEPTATTAPTFTTEPSQTPTETQAAATETALPTVAGTEVPTIAPTVDSSAMGLIIVGVLKNESISVLAQNFPAGQTFDVYVGNPGSFAADKVKTQSISSGSGGSFRFTVNLPSEVDNLEQIALLLQSNSGAYAITQFVNETSGNVSYLFTSTPSKVCEVSSSHIPSGELKPGDDFDAKWEVTNTSGAKWDKKNTDYGYVKGEEMHEGDDLYDLTESVEAGETVEIIVDMVAPDDEGTYLTYWALKVDSTVICWLPLSIEVEK